MLKTELEAKAKSSEEAAETLRIELERVKDQKSSLEEEKKIGKMVGGLGN
jgi:FtsZ-binding cell division protein ZapB